MGTNAWNTFVLRVEHPYIVGKLEKSLDISEPTFHAEKTACYRLQQQTNWLCSSAIVIKSHSSWLITGESVTVTRVRTPSHCPTCSCTRDADAPLPEVASVEQIHGPAGGLTGGIVRLRFADLVTGPSTCVGASVVNSGNICGE